MIISIDPGLGSSLAIFSDSIELIDTPTEEILTGRKTKKGNPQKRRLYIEQEMVKVLKRI